MRDWLRGRHLIGDNKDKSVPIGTPWVEIDKRTEVGDSAPFRNDILRRIRLDMREAMTARALPASLGSPTTENFE